MESQLERSSITSPRQAARPITVTSADGTTIACDVSGAGPPLVIVMGALGHKDFSYARQMADELAKDFTVYNYDRRGRGSSTDTKPYDLGREVEDLAAVARAAGGRPYVFATSSGAALALHAAARGVPMAALLAWEPPYMVGAHKKPSHDAYRPTVERLVAEGRRDEAVSFFMRTVGLPWIAVMIMRLFPFWRSMRSVAHTLPYDAAAMTSFDIPTELFAHIPVPVVVGTGGKSPRALQDGAKAVSDVVPGARLRLVPKQSHGVKPAAVATVLREMIVH
jgi:pimeloyl-ACP methyl ester carboxylesterase